MKKYTRATLVAMCDGATDGAMSGVEAVLPWHTLGDGGLWLRVPPDLVGQAEREVTSWHPLQDREQPALPIPFTARDLAAFMLSGGGLFLHERFDGDDEALGELDRNARNASEVVREALRLWDEAAAKFGRADDGVRQAAKWLADPVGGEPSIAAPTPAPRVRWTPEALAELAAYRDKHGTKAAAKNFAVSEARVRSLLPGARDKPMGYSVFRNSSK